MAGIPRRASGRGVRHLTDGQMQEGFVAGIPRRASGRGVRHLTDGQMQKGSEGGQLSCQLLTRRALGVGLGTLGCGRGGRAPFDRWSNAGGLRGGHPAASQPGRAVAFDRWSNAEGGLGADASCRRKEAGLRGGWACRVLRALVLAAMRQASFTHLAGYPGEGPWLDEDAWDFDAAVGWQEAAGQPEPTHLYASSSSSPLPPWKPGFGTWRVVVVPVKRMPPTPGPRGGGPWVPVSRHTPPVTGTTAGGIPPPAGRAASRRSAEGGCSAAGACFDVRPPCGLLLADGGPGQLAAAGGLFRGQPP